MPGVPVLADRAYLGADPWVTTPNRHPTGGDLSPRPGVLREVSPGWRPARRSAGTLADQLVLLGMDSDLPGLMADVNVSGDGLVQLGTVRPEAAELLAALITAGLHAELAGPASERGLSPRQREKPAACAGPRTPVVHDPSVLL